MSTSGDEHQQQLVVYKMQSEAEETSHGDSLVHWSEAWFAEVVGLPNWGLDPRKDVNHVSNKDIWFYLRTRFLTRDTCGSSASLQA